LHPPSRVDRKSTGTSSTAQGVPVASLEDIIRDKEIGDRPKDRLALVGSFWGLVCVRVNDTDPGFD
jgi:hypothetical protein